VLIGEGELSRMKVNVTSYFKEQRHYHNKGRVTVLKKDFGRVEGEIVGRGKSKETTNALDGRRKKEISPTL
jgi:hypothetical protein